MTKVSTEKINIRELALETLIKVLEEGELSSAVIQNTLKVYQYLDKKERAFYTRLCEGTIERVLELDYIINQFSKVKIKKMKPVIRNILRMGVYQMKYMEQVPDRAACNEAVKLAQRKGFHTLKSFVNGVLRNIGRNMDTISYPSVQKEPVAALSIAYSMPEWIVNMWIEAYGLERTEGMLKASFLDRQTTVRCNLQNASIKDTVALLEKEGVKVQAGDYVDTALKISGYNYLGGLSAFSKGYITVQDESSMMVAYAAGVKKDDLVLDICAAPGGKSLHIADMLGGTGMISARDLTGQKVERINENISRIGISNINTKVWDARELDEEFVEKADVVIADLPCSGLGVIGKKNDIKYKIKPEGMEELVKLQREIFKVAVQYVKPGGTLIYSTCTVNKKENEENVAFFLENSSLELESLVPYLPEKVQNPQAEKGYIQFFPGEVNMDGFFIARFRKRK